MVAVVFIAEDGAVVLAEVVDATVGFVVDDETSVEDEGSDLVAPTFSMVGEAVAVDDGLLLEVAVSACICCVDVHIVH